jgi:predicted ferric reductase
LAQASRCIHRARVTAYNLSLTVFLALKNTPLALLTAFPYERLNILHQTAGYCTVLSAMLHAITYLVTLSQEDTLQIMREQNQIMGIVAGSTLLLILTTALTLRRVSYEPFYVTHVVLFMLLMIALGLHRPSLALKAIYIFFFTASVWTLDHLYRFTKLSWLAYGNTAVVIPLQYGGVRITLSRTPKRAIPGSHIFLWLPKIRRVEMHPFTVVSTNPLELVVSAHNGFTKDLLSFASKNSGARFRASCDGPYGTLPNFSKFDHVILIAGGSGASFTLGVAVNLIRKSHAFANQPIIHFIWVIREHGKQISFPREEKI